MMGMIVTLGRPPWRRESEGSGACTGTAAGLMGTSARRSKPVLPETVQKKKKVFQHKLLLNSVKVLKDLSEERLL